MRLRNEDKQTSRNRVCKTYRKGVKGKYQLVVASKRWVMFKAKLKEVTRKTTPMSFDERMSKLNSIQRGWINYFQFASMQQKLIKLDGWLRNRIRYCLWHHWKKPERKRKNLIRLGVKQGQAYSWSRTRMGGCPPAGGSKPDSWNNDNYIPVKAAWLCFSFGYLSIGFTANWHLFVISYDLENRRIQPVPIFVGKTRTVE